MTVIYATNNNSWHNCAIRTSRGAKVMTLNLAERPVLNALKQSGVDLEGSGINIGSGIYVNGGCCDSNGKGVNIIGNGALVEKCEAMNPAMEDILIKRVSGSGIGSFFKKGAQKLFAIGKQKVLPQLLSAGKQLGKQLIDSGKRVALDVGADIASDLTKAAVETIGNKVENKTVANLLQSGAQNLGRKAQSALNSAVDKEEAKRSYNNAENKLSVDIANRSRSLIQSILAKNKRDEAAGSGSRTGTYVNDYFSS